MGGEQPWGNQDYGNEQWGGYEGTDYLRSLAALAEAPIVSVKNSFDALADRHDSPIDVPILDLVVTSRRKIRNKTKNDTKFIDNKCDCSSHPTTSTGPGRCPPTPLTMGGNPKPVVEHEIVANRNPELATAWTKHKAITNYENFYNIGVDVGRDYITSIETVANSSLGIDGWALFDVGLAEDSGAAAEVGGAVPLSICLIGSSTNMFEWYSLASADPPRPHASGSVSVAGASPCAKEAAK